MCAKKPGCSCVAAECLTQHTKSHTCHAFVSQQTKQRMAFEDAHNTGSITQQLMHTLPQLMTAVQLHSDCARQAMAIDRCCHVAMTHIKRCRGPVQSTSECQGHAEDSNVVPGSLPTGAPVSRRVKQT